MRKTLYIKILKNAGGKKMRRYSIVLVVFAVLFAYGFGSYAAGVGNFSNQILKQGEKMIQTHVTKNKRIEILPDLTIIKIAKIKNKPLVVNDNSQGFVISIKNIGSEDVRNQDIKVKLTYGNKSITRQFYGLAIHHTKELKIAPVIFTQGGKNYRITAQVDYNNAIKEKNEDNNKLSKVFYVSDALVIKTMKAQIGRSGKNLYVSVITNKPIKDMKNMEVYYSFMHIGERFPDTVRFNHAVNTTTYIYGPVDISCICKGSPKMGLYILAIQKDASNKQIRYQTIVKLKYVIKSQSFASIKR